jgi:hypothetical protein
MGPRSRISHDTSDTASPEVISCHLARVTGAIKTAGAPIGIRLGDRVIIRYLDDNKTATLRGEVPPFATGGGCGRTGGVATVGPSAGAHALAARCSVAGKDHHGVIPRRAGGPDFSPIGWLGGGEGKHPPIRARRSSRSV